MAETVSPYWNHCIMNPQWNYCPHCGGSLMNRISVNLIFDHNEECEGNEQMENDGKK